MIPSLIHSSMVCLISSSLTAFVRYGCIRIGLLRCPGSLNCNPTGGESTGLNVTSQRLHAYATSSRNIVFCSLFNLLLPVTLICSNVLSSCSSVTGMTFHLSSGPRSSGCNGNGSPLASRGASFHGGHLTSCLLTLISASAVLLITPSLQMVIYST